MMNAGRGRGNGGREQRTENVTTELKVNLRGGVKRVSARTEEYVSS
jgi:hypothetical protein